MTALAGWENFYVIVGSSAGALIGLQFVVITLMAEMPIVRDMERATHAFGTPTIVHFGAVLLLSAAVSAPWRGTEGVAIVLGVIGGAGVIYVLVAARRMRVQTAYSPVFEDWLYFVLLPFAAYATVTGAAWVVRSEPGGAAFGVGGAALLLLFIGIHNAWDTVTYHVFTSRRREDERER
jgi:hypothetical protein